MKRTKNDDTFNVQDYKKIIIPTVVGCYRLGEGGQFVQFNLTKKPNWFHRTMMRLCLGFKWVTFNTKEK